MNDLITIKEVSCLYYLSFIYDSGMYDNGVALPMMADIKPSYYENMLLSQFNAIKMGPFFYFSNMKDIVRAKAWIDSEIVMNKLRKC